MLSISEDLQLIQTLAISLTAILALLAWLESRRTTAKVKQTHDLVNSQSETLLKAAKAIAFREGVEHADATDAAQLSQDLTDAENETNKTNGH